MRYMSGEIDQLARRQECIFKFGIKMNAGSKKIASTVQERGMTKMDAAAYCGCESLAAFDDWVRRGIVPGPIPGTRR
jgi:hypothetical protein